MSDELEDREVTVIAVEMTAAQHDALFDRIADAAHALDEQVTCGGGPYDPAATDELLTLRASVAAARALHRPNPPSKSRYTSWCGHCQGSWPCSTIRALGSTDPVSPVRALEGETER